MSQVEARATDKIYFTITASYRRKAQFLFFTTNYAPGCYSRKNVAQQAYLSLQSKVTSRGSRLSTISIDSCMFKMSTISTPTILFGTSTFYLSLKRLGKVAPATTSATSFSLS